jgi:hypothetical protein
MEDWADTQPCHGAAAPLPPCITCPAHMFVFDLVSGRSMTSHYAAAVYPVLDTRDTPPLGCCRLPGMHARGSTRRAFVPASTFGTVNCDLSLPLPSLSSIPVLCSCLWGRSCQVRIVGSLVYVGLEPIKPPPLPTPAQSLG